jgi:putative intracellular protease/amidase
MKIALFYYDGFSEFEVVLACLIFRRYDLISIALENREYKSEECQRFCVDKIIKDVDIDSIDLLVIPGGEPAPLVENLDVEFAFELARQMNLSKKEEEYEAGIRWFKNIR